MSEVIIREPTIEDKEKFLLAMKKSESLHYPCVKAPLLSEEFDEYLKRFNQSNQKSFLVFDQSNHLVGVFNISEIVRGLFQNAYLGFYAVNEHAGKGYMSAGLKLVLQKVFKELNLHRLEANIQPENSSSIWLVKKNGFRYEGFSPRYLKIGGEWRGHEHWVITLEDYIRNDSEILSKDYVGIVSYNLEWPMMASDEINKLKTILPFKIIDIQHVGSTAISGMSAKPIIDIQIAVNSLAEIKTIAIQELQKLGYEYWFENPDPTKMFFVKGMPPFGQQRTHHVHIFEYGSDHWRNKIIFRDYLRSNKKIAKEYEELKNKLAKEHQYDREKYTDAKLEFIHRILKLASNQR